MASPSPEPTGLRLRTLSFGELETGRWGAVWLPGSGPDGMLALGDGAGAAEALAAEISADGDGAEWTVHSAAGTLSVRPTHDPEPLPEHDGGLWGFEQLAAVSGQVTVGGAPIELRSAGRRGERRAAEPPERLDSLREVTAWFDGEEAVALASLRPRKHRGQEQDRTAAVVIDPEGWPPITDSRLSTTYAASGRPARMGLELWTDEEEQIPRRLAGEALGSGAIATAAGWQLVLEPLRCHSRGRDGLGLYLLARPA